MARPQRRSAAIAGEAAAFKALDSPPGVAFEPLVTGDPATAAFFDVDGTVLRGASLFHLARGMRARGFFGARDMLTFARRQLMFRLIGVENPDAMREARETALEFIKGRGVEELRAIGEDIFDDVLADKVWPGTQAFARMHLARGERVWLVTATPQEVASVIAQRLGLTGALGTVAESDGGIYTGRLVGEVLHGVAKAEAVRALAAREDLDLARCAAYSDSFNDMPLLELVGHPFAINPDPRLRVHARRHGWHVEDYRTGRKAARVCALGAVAGAVGTTVVVLARQTLRRS